MPDFLLELLTEEIPARMQRQAAEQFAARFGDGIKGKLPGGTVKTFVTPRRLIVYATGLGAQGNAAEEERRGPRADAPPQAIDGFVRATGVSRDALEERDTPKGRFLYATIREPGRPAAAVLADLIPGLVRDFDWPKSMRWGAASARTDSPRWVRPLSGIVALLDDAVVPFEAAGIASGRTTMGHRFMSEGAIEIASAATYADQLRLGRVMIDPAERAGVILDGARAAAAAHGLTLIDDTGLVAENAGLTEWPVPLLGRFDPTFLDVPREVIQLTMRTNQKYFACADASGALAPAFVCVANLEARDGGAGIVAGNRKVLAARLADAKFFWDQDRAVTLEARLPKLGQIVFHEKLGTVADKVERVAKLARWLVESGAIDPLRTREDRAALATLAETAARLCKADLVSSTVGEFPEVQGIAGGHLALAEGLDPRIAAAIRDHYKPVGPSDAVPTAPVTVAVALGDKLDTIVAFFRIEQFPTGSRDPFALRRAALATVRLVTASAIRLPLLHVFAEAQSLLQRQISLEALGAGTGTGTGEGFGGGLSDLPAFILEFFADRLKVQQREAGVRPDIIDAVFALGGEDDLVRLLARVRALQAFLATPDGATLLAGYKRAANILRIEEGKGDTFAAPVDPARLVEPAEIALGAALDSALPDVTAAIRAEDFTAAMSALSHLRPAVDAFFEAVTVNAPEQSLRINRLNLLNRLREAVHTVADFAKIEG